jgi:hypothetical protein
MKVGTLVTSIEHPKAIGEVIRINDAGVTVQFITPASESLPFGHIITEFWPVSEIHLLTEV